MASNVLGGPKGQALIGRTILGFVLVEIPVLTFQLSQPVFDWRLTLVGFLGAAAGFLDKLLTNPAPVVRTRKRRVRIHMPPPAAPAT